MNNITKKSPGALALLAVSFVALAGCAAETAPATTPSSPAAEVVAVEDAWVKASPEGMSAAFGLLHNGGEDSVTVVSAEADASSMVELHETVTNEAGEMVMREIDGGFVIPAGEDLALVPGADHLMLMGLTGPLLAGEDAVITLTFSDGSSYEFNAPIKDYSGANENYDEGMEH